MGTATFNGRAILKSILILTTMLGMALTSASAISAKPDSPPGKAKLVAVYDYRDFAPTNVVQRVFDVTNLTQIETIVENLTYPTEQELLIDRSSGSGNSLYHYSLTETDVLLDWHKQIDPVMGATTWEYDPPLSVRQSVMPEGVNRGGGARSTSDYYEYSSGYSRFNSALGLEDITVPYGAFSGCLRMSEVLTGGFARTSWYCPGVGLTKRIEIYGQLWELSDCIGCPMQ